MGLALLAASCFHSSDSDSETSSSTTASTAATEDPAPEGDVDACELVGADAATDILGDGAFVDTSEGETFGATSICTWVTPADALLVVSVFEGRQFYSDVIPGAEPIAIGDEANITVEPTFGGVVIQFIKGDFVVSLSAVPFGVADVGGLPDAMTDAALAAAARLP